MKRCWLVLFTLVLLGLVFIAWSVWPRQELSVSVEELAMVEACTDGILEELHEGVLRPEASSGPGSYTLALDLLRARKLLPDDYKVFAKLVGEKELPVGVYYRIHGGPEMLSLLVLFEDGEAPSMGAYELVRISPRSFEVSRQDM